MTDNLFKIDLELYKLSRPYTIGSDSDFIQKLFWPGLIGVEKTETLLIKNLSSQNYGHPVVTLIGREGLGKHALVAKSIASVACESMSACGSCPSCIRIMNNKHPDVLWLHSEKSTLTLDSINAFVEHFSLKAGTQGSHFTPYRYGIISAADKLTVSASNKLLKLLEEPPANSRFFLISSKAEKLLDTIKSRSIRVFLNPPKSDITLDWLQSKFNLLLTAIGSRGSDQNIKELIRDCGYSPQAVLSQLVKLAQQDEWPKQIDDLLNNHSLDRKLAICQKLVNDKERFQLDEIIGIIEKNIKNKVLLCLENKQDARHGAMLMNLKNYRKMLHTLKKYSENGQIPLNLQYFFENLALLRW